MTGKEPRYLSYLLRLWQTSDDGERIWRASLESPGSGERQGFASLQDLFDFLAAQMDQAALPDKFNRNTDTFRGRRKK